MALFFTSILGKAQYCAPLHSNNCAATSIITKVQITGTSLYNIVGACASNSPVTVFAATGFQTCTLYRDSGYNIYTLSVTTNNNTKQKVGMWIDFNHDYVFDTVAEWFLISASNVPNMPSTITFTVPSNAAIGQTEMRIRTRNAAAAFDSSSYCKTLGSGTTHRYTITIDSLSTCSGSPTAGNMAITADSVCNKITVFFAKTGGSWALGQTIQWQWSTDSINWSDLQGDTLLSITKAVTQTGYYRYYTACGGNADTTAAQFIYVYPLTTCLCTPGHINFCNTNHLITNVSVTGTGVNNTVSKCQSAASVWWQFGPSSGTSDSIYLGNTYEFKVTTNFKDIIGMWVDFNHNAVFDTYEWFLINKSSTANATSSLYVTIPTTADTGYTPVRIRAISAGTVLDSSGACKVFVSGNSHDYQLYLRPLPPCTNPPTAGNAITTDTLICANSAFTLSLQGNTFGAGQSYQWQQSATGNAGTWSDLSGDTNSGAVLMQTTSNYYRCFVNCGGNGDTSTTVFVDLKTFYDCYCSQGIHTNTCDSTQMLTNVRITSTSLNNTVNSCSISSTAPHFVFSPSGNLTTDLVRGKTYRFNATSNISGTISAWIDYNKSGSYDSAEWTRIAAVSGINVNNAVNITIPANTPLGLTGLRIRLRNGAAVNTAKYACTTFANGTTHDYIINIIDPYTTDVGPNRLVSPANALCYTNNEPVTVQITNYASDTLDFTKKNLTVSVDFNGVSTANFDTTITTGILAPGANMNIYFVDTVDMSTPATAYTFKVYTTLANDSNIYNDTLNITRNAAQKMALNYIEKFNSAASIPASYTGNGFGYNATNGVGGTGSLRTTFTNNTNSAGVSRSPVVGPLTSISALRFSYKSSAVMQKTDSVFVQLSTDCGINYTTVFNINATNTLNNSYASIQYSLGAFTGNSAVIRLVKMDSSAVLSYVDIDNMVIGDVPDINLGNDTVVCDKILLNANPNAKGWDVNWSTGAGPQDTLTIYNSGNYIATASDKTYGLVNSDTIKITIYTTPKVKLGNSQTVCNGTGVKLDAGSWPSGYTYIWNTGDTTQTITVYTSGTYSVIVNNVAGCAGKSSVKINVVNKPQGVNLTKAQNFTGQFNQGTASNPDLACVGNSMSYNITPPSGYSNAQYGSNWSILIASLKTITGGNAAGVVTISYPSANSGNINFIPAKADADSVFVITLMVKDKITGCDTTLYRYLNVNPNPIVSLGNDLTVCPGISVNFNAGSSFAQYLWSDGSTGSSISPTTVGIYWIKVTDNNSCNSIDTVLLNNYSLPKVDIGKDQTVCPGTAVTFTSVGIWPKYVWNDGSTNNQLTTTNPGTYWMKATDNNGCTNTDSALLNNFTPPTVNLGADKSICPNNSVTIDGGTATSYNWNTAASTQTISVSSAGTYWLEVSDANGCKGRDSINVNILPKPKATFTYVKNTATNIQFTPDDITHTAYNWTFGDGNNSNAVSPLHNYSLISNYVVNLVVTSINTCTDSSNQTLVLSGIAEQHVLVNELNAFPNPYTHETNISFALAKTSFADIALYDLYGRKINTISHGNMSAGKHILNINTAQYASVGGIYFIRIYIDGEISVLRIIDLSAK